jgi:type II secretory pathway component GspD/PulD (secretin)
MKQGGWARGIVFGLLCAFVARITAEPASSRLANDVVQLAQQPSAPAAAATSTNPEASEAKEIARLDSLPAVQIPVEDATLASAIKIVAQSAGMNFIAPATEDFSETISLNATINPWRLLQLMADRYRFNIQYRGGLWLFSRESAGALIAKTYQFRHANLDSVTSQSGQGDSMNSNSDPETGRALGQGFDLVYKIDSKQVVEDVRELVGLPPLASQTMVAVDGKLPTDRTSVPAILSENKSTDKGQKVLYLPKTNALYVVCYRSQHEHIAEYVRQVDQPPVQIRIEARFFSTSSDPETILGIDYSNAQPNLSLSDANSQAGGNQIALQKLTDKRWPPQAILSSSALSLQLNALEKDSKSEKIENPFVVTTSNHEALFSVGQEEPFLDSSTLSPGAVDGGLGSTTNRISVKRIGTAVNVVPTYFAGEPGEKPKIRLVIKIELGRLSGFRQVTPQVLYPIVDSQKYEFTATVEEGQALAFGGLTGLSSSSDDNRVPVLGRIPLLGGLFKHTDKKGEQQNLIGYLIPSIVHGSAAPAPLVELKGDHASL